MHVSPATFGSVVAYLDGFDRARNFRPLAGFRQWLFLRSGRTGDNWHWAGYAQLILQTGGEQTEESLITGLGLLLDEYLTYRRKNGLQKVLDDHARYFEIMDARYERRQERRRRRSN